MGYPDPRVAIATLHGKAEAIGPALAAIGLQVQTVAVDTNALGTFAGEIERPGSARAVVVAKARLGMATSGLALGLATEGSFGPDPVLGFLPLHEELLAFVDAVHGQVIVLEHASHDTNWRTRPLRPGDDLAPLLAEIGLPEHAVLVKPNAWQGAAALPTIKGLRAAAAVAEAVTQMAACSADGCARVEADLRAHMNPTRMRAIASLGEALARRLATPCPACGVPGFGRIDAEPGLPCADCGTPTSLLRAEIHGCGACAFRVERPRIDGLTTADAGHCPQCNP